MRTVAQRHEITCQSHISSVRVGLRPWMSEHHTLLPPLGVTGHVSLLGPHPAVFQSGPGEGVCSNSMERVFHHAAHISFMLEGSREKKISHQWPCYLLAGPQHTLLRKVSPLI